MKYCSFASTLASVSQSFGFDFFAWFHQMNACALKMRAVVIFGYAKSFAVPSRVDIKRKRKIEWRTQSNEQNSNLNCNANQMDRDDWSSMRRIKSSFRFILNARKAINHKPCVITNLCMHNVWRVCRSQNVSIICSNLDEWYLWHCHWKARS